MTESPTPYQSHTGSSWPSADLEKAWLPYENGINIQKLLHQKDIEPDQYLITQTTDGLICYLHLLDGLFFSMMDPDGTLTPAVDPRFPTDPARYFHAPSPEQLQGVHESFEKALAYMRSRTLKGRKRLTRFNLMLADQKFAKDLLSHPVGVVTWMRDSVLTSNATEDSQT